jgi:hypothetical protein
VESPKGGQCPTPKLTMSQLVPTDRRRSLSVGRPKGVPALMKPRTSFAIRNIGILTSLRSIKTLNLSESLKGDCRNLISAKRSGGASGVPEGWRPRNGADSYQKIINPATLIVSESEHK